MDTPVEGPYLRLRETHVAGVLMMGERVFKFKKPVDFGFLDFSTREARAEACRREVELNRRFSPDVYLGVASLSLPAGAQEPEGLQESVVVMRRMPDSRRLAHLVSLGVDVREDLRMLARQMAVVHDLGERRPEIDTEASLERLKDRWEDSFEQVRAHASAVEPPDRLDEVERRTRRFLDGRESLFSQRLSDGCAVDGHGDLLADDIFCLDDGPRILDCLEFDDQLRFVDRIDDVCFLAMDLERLGAPELGAAFINWYADFSGDNAVPALVHHYIAYRAFVRAKVACLRHEQGDDHAEEIDSYLTVAEHHLAEGAVTLVLVGGPPGSGKTTVAGGIADRMGMVVLSADRVRKELAGLDPSESAAAPFGTGIYSEEHTERTYTELMRRAQVLLGLGESVVLDATWTRDDARDQARAVAGLTCSDLVELRCEVPSSQTETRVAQRRAHGQSISDADVDIAATLRTAADPWTEAFAVDTSRTVDESVEAAVARVRAPAPNRDFDPPKRRPNMSTD